jgi:GH25 family lysozyme M1 (1,4-beta-N-acetylmuramidase)
MPRQPRIDGIDIHPRYQNPVYWNELPDLKVFTVKTTDGTTLQNYGGLAYFQMARTLNIPYIGMYHWLFGDQSLEGQVQAIRRAWAAVGGIRPGEFVQIDWEDNKHPCTLAFIEAFLNRLEQFFPGRIIVYSADWVFNFKQWRARHPNYPLWYSNFFDNRGDDEAEPRMYSADVWQWAVVEANVVSGIPDRCDVNEVWNEETLQTICGLFHAPTGPARVTNPQKEDTLVLIRREENDMVLSWDGTVLKRVNGAEAELMTKSVANRTALYQIIENNKVTGVNPFRAFPGYEDGDLATLWDSRPQV